MKKKIRWKFEWWKTDWWRFGLMVYPTTPMFSIFFGPIGLDFGRMIDFKDDSLT